MKRSGYVMVCAALALAAMAGQAAAQDRLMEEAKDRVTGATVRVYRTSAGPRIDVLTPAVQLRKQLVGDKVVTSLSGPGESLVIEASPGLLSVVSSRGRASAAPGDAREIERTRQLVAESPLTARAAALIGRMGFGERSAIEPLLITTRAFLLAVSNDPSGVREMRDWARKIRDGVRVIKTTGGQRTPTDCWAAYSAELLAAWDGYVDCVNNLRWWDPIGEPRCAVVYEVRILGAFTWYAGCVSLGSVIGR